MKTKDWNGHSIRFVEKGGAWRAVAADVCKALDIDNHRDAVQGVQNSLQEAGLDEKGVVSNYTLPTNDGKQRLLCVNGAGLNLLIMRSRKKEAVALMDREHQNAAMRRLNNKLPAPVKVDYIKANTIADKAVSTRYGFSKMVKKGAMSEAMLHDRQSVLDGTVQLMALNERLGLGLSVSEAVYAKYAAGMGGAA